MATLRLFAGLRDAAGTSRVEMPGSTVGEVIEEASRRFGPSFEASVPKARVWLNGEEAEPSDTVGDSDEVALIPPVSGGSQAISPSIGANAGGVVLTLLALGVVAAAVWGSEAMVAAALVGVISVWVADIGSVLSSRGRDLPVIPVFVTIAAAVVATRLLGAAGLAVAVAAAVIAPMVWGLVSETSRLIQIIAPAVLVSLIAGSAAASLLHVVFSQPATTLGVFIVVVLVAVPAVALGERFRNLPVGDPFTITAFAAIAAALVAAAVWELDLAANLFVGVVLAVGLIAGTALGSIIRTQSVSLVERPPGLTWAADGALIAAALYYPIVALIS